LLSERDEQDLLHAMSLIRRVLHAHGVGKDIPASITRCAQEICAHTAIQTQDEDIREPEPIDSQADGFAEQQD
jgi:hypothetical protein